MPTAQPPQRFGDLEPSQWPGERLGLPDTGQRSVARIGRRVAAILIDWGLAMIIAYALAQGTPHVFLTHGIFIVMQIVFITTLGGSLGHRVLGMRVVPLTGGWIGLWKPVVRTLLLVLVIPVLVWDSDQRGFHDKIPGTVLIRY